MRRRSRSTILRRAVSEPSASHETPPPVEAAVLDEAALVARARSGDFDAFERLVARHERRIYGIALRLVGQRDAEDVVQSTFLSAVEHLPDLKADGSFGGWVARIATNLGLRVLRTRRAHPTSSLDDNGGADDDAPIPRPQAIAPWRDDPVRLVESRELRRILDEALEAISEKHRAVFVLRDLAGLSVEETAQALEITPGNVKVRHLRARLALRERLTGVFGDETRRVGPEHGHGHGHEGEGRGS